MNQTDTDNISNFRGTLIKQILITYLTLEKCKYHLMDNGLADEEASNVCLKVAIPPLLLSTVTSTTVYFSLCALVSTYIIPSVPFV